MAARRPVARGGIWSSTAAPVSKETQDLLKMMMEESKLTSFQRRHLQENIKKGNALPAKCQPTSSERKKPESTPPKQTKGSAKSSSLCNKRSKETIEVMTNGYQRENYRPSPGKKITEEDKARLQNRMAYGIDTPSKEINNREIAVKRGLEKNAREEEIDRFDEVLKEIEDRRQFLDEMEELGQGQKYRSIIAGEISMKIRELELIDSRRSKELEKLIQEEEK